MPSHGRLRYLEAAAQPVTVAGRAGQTHGTLLLLHAFPLNARMWEGQLSLAEHGWRIVAPHLRGFDGGATDPSGTTMDDYAGDVVDLLDTLHISEAVLCGLSMGGYAAFAVWRHAPQYVRALVLADTRPQADTPDAKQARDKMLALVREKGPSAVAEEMLPRLLGETTVREQPQVVERVRGLINSNSTEAIAGAIHALKTRQDSTALLPSIHVPTLVIVGEEDVITPPPLSEAMHDGIHGSELVKIQRAGHLSNLEQPSAFNAALIHFLDRI